MSCSKSLGIKPKKDNCEGKDNWRTPEGSQKEGTAEKIVSKQIKN